MNNVFGVVLCVCVCVCLCVCVCAHVCVLASAHTPVDESVMSGIIGLFSHYEFALIPQRKCFKVPYCLVRAIS